MPPDPNALLRDIRHEFSHRCVYDYSLGWQCLHVASYILAASVILGTVFLEPPWWKQFLVEVGLSNWLWQCFLVWIVCVIGPVKFFANRQLWMSRDYTRFMPPSEYGDVEEKLKGLMSKRNFAEIGKWIVAYYVVPSVSLSLAEVQNWRWFMMFIVIPESFRVRLTNKCEFPFKLAVQGTNCRAEHETARLKSRTEGDCNKPEVWIGVCTDHQQLDEDLSALWKDASKVFASTCLEGVSVAAAMSVMSFATEKNSIAVGLNVFGLVIGLGRLRPLKPLAEATAICHEMPKIASRSVRSIMGDAVVIQYIKAMQHFQMNPVGVEIPGLGQVTSSLLAAKLSPLVAAFPVISTTLRQHIDLVQG